MPLLIGLILIFVAFVVLSWLTFTVMHLVLMLVMAGIIGWLADQIIPGRLPYGALGAVVAGLVGSWLGSILIGNFGPPIFGIRVIPALIGALILTAAITLLGPVLGGKKPRNLPTRWSEP